MGLTFACLIAEKDKMVTKAQRLYVLGQSSSLTPGQPNRSRDSAGLLNMISKQAR